MDRKPLVSEVRVIGGVPTLLIDHVPHTGLMHWNRHPAPEDIRIFRDAGIHLYSFMGTLPIREDPDVPVSYDDGLKPVPELSREFLDENLSMIEREDPEAKVLIRFRITPPVWMRKPESGHLIRVYDPQTRTYADTPHISVCDPVWRATVARALETMIDDLEERWPHRVMGYHPGMACCAENAYYWGNYIGDFSRSHLAGFRHYLQNKYGSPERLNAAWHSAYPSFDAAEFPDPEIFFGREIREENAIAEPERCRQGIDFLDFSSQIMADTVVFQAHTVKEALRRRNRTKVCAVFYAYELQRENSLSPLCSGHHAHDAVLKCPDIDILCSPLGYSGRQRGGIASCQVLPGSLNLHGKLYYGEDDYRYHLAQDEPDCISASPEETEPLLIRNFLSVWRTGGTVWWMDLFGKGWYRDKRFGKLLGFCRHFAETHSEARASTASIAVFVSDRARNAERAVPLLYSGALIEETVAELSVCGAPFDLFRIEDLPELAASGKLKQYRMAVMTNIFRLDGELRQLIGEHLKKDGRTIFWIGCPGIIQDDVYSEENVSALTGIKLVDRFNLWSENLLTETFWKGRRLVYGDSRNWKPRMIAADPEAENLGWFIQGTCARHLSGSTGGALTVKKFPEWNSVWSSSFGIPAELFTYFAEAAGVRIYSHDGDQIFAAEDWVAVYAKSTGTHAIDFPNGFAPAAELVTGKSSALESGRLELHLERGDLRVFVKN